MKVQIENIHLLTDVFGGLPSFHDAEVLKISLDRGSLGKYGPNLEAVIHVFEITPEIDERNRYVLKNNVLVDLRFTDISDLRIDGFNHQNVIWDIRIESSSAYGPRFHVNFVSSHGADVEFECQWISVESVVPYVPEKSLH